MKRDLARLETQPEKSGPYNKRLTQEFKVFLGPFHKKAKLAWLKLCCTQTRELTKPIF